MLTFSSYKGIQKQLLNHLIHVITFMISIWTFWRDKILMEWTFLFRSIRKHTQNQISLNVSSSKI